MEETITDRDSAQIGAEDGPEAETTASDEATPSSNTTRRVVLATGISLDKRELYEVTKAMSLDWDLRRLSLLGPVLWNFFVLSVVAVGIFALFSQLTTILGLVESAVASLRVGSLATVGNVVRGLFRYGVPVGGGMLLLSPVSVVLLRHGYETVSGVTSGVENIADTLAKSLVLFDTDTWKNTNYWHPFTAHHSDRDPLVLFANGGDETAVSGVYTDVPYYRNVFVDSVYVTIEGVTGKRKHELTWLERRFRRPRRYAMAGLALVGGATLVVPYLPGITLGPTLELVGAISNSLFLLLAVSVLLTKHFRFHSEFYANTAGAAEYDALLHEDPQTLLVENEDRYEDTTLLGNSLAGYGIFYLSELFRNVIGDERPYACRIAAETGDDGALEAGKDVVAASLPGPTSEVAPGDRVTVKIHGVKHLQQDDEYDRGFRETIQQLLRRGDGGEKPKQAYMNVAGTARGIRLPVKRYMSVPFGPTREDNRATEDGRDGFPTYFDDSWTEDEVHYLLVGGAEHQQGLLKLVQYLKRQGYENVDLVENTFASEEDFKFSSEYFVSSVLGGPDEDVFRGNDSFLYLRHRHENGHYIHAIVGLSARATKMGGLYWRNQFPKDEQIEDDVLYHVSYETEGVDDVGDYYVTPEVSDDGVDPLSFEWEDDPNASEGRIAEKSDSRIGCQTATLTITDDAK